MKYFHGTSADNLASILQYGISCNEEKLWGVSGDEIYLWSPDKMHSEAEDRGISPEELAFQVAFESAQFACAKAKDCRAVILLVELREGTTYPDSSCDNMADRGAMCINRDILPEEIKEIHISNDLSLIRGYFLYMHSSNEYSALEMNEFEERVAELFKDSYLLEDIEGMTTWETQIKESCPA